MRTRWISVGIVVLGIGAAGCGGESTTTLPASTAVTTTPEAEVVRPPKPDFVVIVVGTTVSGGGRKTVKLGDTVRVQVIADTKDEVHLHGYDKKVDVASGMPASLMFTADVPGIFEVELESRGLKLLDLVIK
jgi:hypothetical protein